MLRGVTFTVPTTDIATADQIIAKFPQVADKKIPMRCRFNAETNHWECDIPTLWERRSTWAVVGGAFGAFLLGAMVGRKTA